MEWKDATDLVWSVYMSVFVGHNHNKDHLQLKVQVN